MYELSLFVLELQKRITEVSSYTVISPDNKLIYYAQANSDKIMTYIPEQDTSFLFNEITNAQPVSISPDSKHIAIVPKDFSESFIKIYDINLKTLITEINFENIELPQYQKTKFTADNKNICIINKNKICIYDIKTGKLQKEIQNSKYKMQIKDFVFCNNNQIIIAYEGKSDNIIMLNY